MIERIKRCNDLGRFIRIIAMLNLNGQRTHDKRVVVYDGKAYIHHTDSIHIVDWFAYCDTRRRLLGDMHY